MYAQTSKRFLILKCTRETLRSRNHHHHHHHHHNRSLFIKTNASSSSSLNTTTDSNNKDSNNVSKERNRQRKQLPRFYFDKLTKTNEEMELTKEESKHALKSLRLKIGDLVEVCDGRGLLRKAKMNEVSSRGIASFECSDDDDDDDDSMSEVPFPGIIKWDCVVACAGIKGGRSDWLVEKLAELNCRALVPLLTKRSSNIGSASANANRRQVRGRGGAEDDGDEESETGKESRWNRVALAASKQSLRAHVFNIEKPVASVKDLVSSQYWKNARFRYVAAMGGVDFAQKLLEAKRDVEQRNDDDSDVSYYGLIVIGPEGDFDDEEMEVLLRQCSAISLGDLRLRTETAAIAAMATAQIITNS